MKGKLGSSKWYHSHNCQKILPRENIGGLGRYHKAQYGKEFQHNL